MPKLDAALTLLRKRANSTYDQGHRFEILVQQVLRAHPRIIGPRFTKVWLWSEWPGRDGPDIGIDLVAEHRRGLVAIQCKFVVPNATIPKKDIDSFMSASDSSEFTDRLIVHTGRGLHSFASRTLRKSSKNWWVLNRRALASWDVNWLRFVRKPGTVRLRQGQTQSGIFSRRHRRYRAFKKYLPNRRKTWLFWGILIYFAMSLILVVVGQR